VLTAEEVPTVPEDLTVAEGLTAAARITEGEGIIMAERRLPRVPGTSSQDQA